MKIRLALFAFFASTLCAFPQTVFVNNSATKAVNVILRDTSGNYVAQSDVLQNPFERHRKPRYDLDELMQVQSGSVFVSNSATKAVNVILRDEAGAYVDASAGGGGGAPTTATYITQTANGTLANEQALGALATGILKSTTTTGVLSIAVAGDFPTLNQSTTGSAATWTTSRTLSSTGDVTYTSGSFNGSGNATGAATVANIPVTATVATSDTAVPLNTGGWTEYFVATSDFTTTSLTAVDITGLVTGTLSATSRYEFEFVLLLTNAADAAGVKIAMHGGGSGTAATVNAAISVPAGSVSAQNAGGLNAIDTLTAAMLSYSAGSGIASGKGFFSTNSVAPLTMSVQLAKVTSNTATCRIGSVFRIRKAHP